MIQGSASKTSAKRKATRSTADPRKATGKTQVTQMSVARFFAGIDHPVRQRDAKALAKLFASVTGEKPRMWGATIVGFGQYHDRYDSGREGDSLRIGFSPRSQNLVLYIMAGLRGSAGLLAKLGKHKVGKSGLYVNKLDDVDLGALEQLVKRAWNEMGKKYPA